MKKATVVIPTYNRAARLSELLECLTQQGDELGRVVVCDDGSTDETATAVCSFTQRLPLVYAQQEHLGFRAGQARNLGIARAVGDVIIFVDDDVLVAPDFVSRHVAAHAGAVRPRMAIGYRHRAFTPMHTLDNLEDTEPDDRVGDLGSEGQGIAGHPTPWFFVYSCNFSITRSSSPTPTFDEAFVGWGIEDLEYGYRLHKAGYEAVAVGARVLHIEDAVPRDPFRCEVRTIEPVYDSYVRNAIYFMDKYPDDKVLAERVRTDLRWYMRDEAQGRWVKNGHANDIEVVLAAVREERAGESQ